MPKKRIQNVYEKRKYKNMNEIKLNKYFKTCRNFLKIPGTLSSDAWCPLVAGVLGCSFGAVVDLGLTPWQNWSQIHCIYNNNKFGIVFILFCNTSMCWLYDDPSVILFKSDGDICVATDGMKLYSDTNTMQISSNE